MQDISLLITSELPFEEIELMEDPYDISKVVTTSSLEGSEWKLMQFVMVEPWVRLSSCLSVSVSANV